MLETEALLIYFLEHNYIEWEFVIEFLNIFRTKL